MKKILITGANGFIGTALLNEIDKEYGDVEVYAVIKDTDEKTDSIEQLPNVNIIYCSMEEIARLPVIMKDKDIDTCIHLAWTGSFGECKADGSVQLQNVQYSLALIHAIKDMGIKRFVGAGTLAELDVLNYHMDDGATPNPASMYGAAKLSTQLFTKIECTKFGIDHIWCYLSNTYGVGDTTNNFINMASRKILNGERAAFTEARQIYDFVYVTDIARAIYYAANKGKKNTSYYLGSGTARPLKEYICMIRDAIDPDYPLYFGEIPFNGKTLSADTYSIEKLQKDTGYSATISFEDGIKKTVSWLSEQ